ncbi:MAG: AmmeMemoRadiSam system radical SAM enzyme [Candidatus Bathyarchaeota archaeon]|nr:AmmeMemoRadiSam system radical SAM enzyme [Candidatus Bathyarchaeota archaeon]MCX8177390.1 AmmeMemoRadiSam system radical SAM enzyme [Candidatus Bathyarchaeota archaeon]MDW8193837.1 AmmeMemoRadiSam system radical SAM enzyme [Nitrososphaerota archaeon]
MREAMLYEKLNDKKVRCSLCGRRCLISEDETGFCLVRKNKGGVLYSLVYGKVISACVDPIEKKPLYHFNPGSSVLSIATVGCNFRCQFCDNWMISQEKKISGHNFPPEAVVTAARDNGCQGISYTYTEPTIFFEYAYDTAKLAHQVGFFNTFVTNGYMSPEAVKTIAPYLDAVTVDFKGGGDPDFYRAFSSVPSVDPIFEALKEMKRNGIHIEITNLVVPKEGDSIEQIRKLATWIKDNLGEDTPFHLLRFHPDYKMTTTPSTPIETLEKAYAAAKSIGLNYVFIGNIPGHPAENTYCPECNTLLIKRHGFEIAKWNLTRNLHCPVCDKEIPIKGKLHASGYAYPFSLF